MNIIKKHLFSVQEALHELLKNPISNIFSIFIIALTIVIPMLFYIVEKNLNIINDNLLGKSNKVYVYLDEKLGAREASKIKHTIKKQDNIRHIEIISKQQALEDVTKILDFKLDKYLDENPLPIVLEVFLNTDLKHLKTSKLEKIIKNIKNISGVSLVEIDIPWVIKINKLLNSLSLIFLGLLGLMSMVVVFLIINTVRLSLQDSVKKITLLFLLGASRSYIRLPYIYLGLFFGLLSGVIALSISYSLWLIIFNKIKVLALFFGDDLSIGFLPKDIIIFFLIFNSILGILSTYIAYIFYGRKISKN